MSGPSADGAYSIRQRHPRYPTRAAVDVVTGDAEFVRGQLLNLSLGGAFIECTPPASLGGDLRVRLADDDAALVLGLAGRVVHFVDERQGRQIGHPVGIGLAFTPLSSSALAQLEHYVSQLAARLDQEGAETGSAIFVAERSVAVDDRRATLSALWEKSLRHGGIFAEGTPPALGTRVDIAIGALTLLGEVVQVSSRGAGIALLEFEGPLRDALRAFIDGSAPTLALAQPERASSAPVNVDAVMLAAQRVFASIERGDLLAAVGLEDNATEQEVRARVASLRRTFLDAKKLVPPPQAARLDNAARAVARLEPVLVVRIASVVEAASLAHRPELTDTLHRLLSDADAAERRGDHHGARRLLRQARDRAPEQPLVNERLIRVQGAIDHLRALELLASADVFINGVGMSQQAAEHAREAASLSTTADVLHRTLRILTKAARFDEAVALGNKLVEENPRDLFALQVLLFIHEKRERWAEAVRIGEALQRMNPDDDELARRLKKCQKKARNA